MTFSSRMFFMSGALALAWAGAPAQAAAPAGAAAPAPAPARGQNEGLGPFPKMVIRGAMLIDGTGSPPRGPVDIVIQGNRIAAVLPAGTPNIPMRDKRPPTDAAYELDATGMYVMPGLFDLHLHAPSTAPDMSHFYKLLLGHGVTSVRTVGQPSSDFILSEKARSQRNEIVAPRIYTYQAAGTRGSGWTGDVNSPDTARAWVKWAAQRGIDGIGEQAAGEVSITRAAVDEARKNKMGVGFHINQTQSPTFNARDAGEAGVTSIEHFYGHFEALLKGTTLPVFPPDYDFGDEIDRWKQVPSILDKIHGPGSKEWKEYLEGQKKNGVFFDPTFTVYEVMRNFRAAYNAEWHDRYDLPVTWDLQQSDRTVHGMSYYDWSSLDEGKWRQFFAMWMKLTNDYKNMGGRVTLASDSAGLLYKTYGVATIEELMLMQEAGFTPLEAIRAGTMHSAQAVFEPKGEIPPTGTVFAGKFADLIVVKENPLADFNVLLGTGALRHNLATGKFERIGGVNFTIKDGIVYDAAKLCADVEAIVAGEKKRLGRPDRLPRS